MNYKICVVTGTRAEYGLLYPLLKKLNIAQQVDLQLVITGTHLLPEFGNTQREVEASGIPIFARVPIDLRNDSKAAMASATGNTLTAFAAYFEEHRPDLLIVLGDRFEIFAASTAAALQNIAVAHIHGGETTEGAVDEFLRHSITKMSCLHFVACEEYRKRVIQLGESPSRVFNVGALGVENVITLPEITLRELSMALNKDLIGRKYSIVTCHPATQVTENIEKDMEELISALDDFPEMTFIITKANADAGGRLINAIWEEEIKRHNNWVLVASLGVKRYLTALKHAQMMIGNSSSGIYEAPALGRPTVNIGDRQKGRMMADSIICCPPTSAAISQSMATALSESFQKRAQQVHSPFGNGTTSHQIVSIIMDYLEKKGISTKKAFYNVDFLYEGH